MASDLEAEFARMGPELVRLRITSGHLPAGWAEPAMKWLATQDRDERSRRDASHASQERIAREAAKDARSASRDARLAVIITAIGTIISLLAWLYPRR